jgi:hypothetical protein
MPQSNDGQRPGMVKQRRSHCRGLITAMSEAAEKPAHRPISDQDIEVLLASANAIQRLIDERNTLRSRVDTLERELARLGQQTRLIVNNYRRLTTECISQFQLIDSEVSNLFREQPTESAESSPAEQPAEAADPEFPPTAA